MKTKRWLCTAALLVPGLAGCGGSSSSTNTSGPIFLVPRSVSSTLSNGLTATLTEDRSTVSVGGTVTYTVALANNTAQPITYQPIYGGGGLAPPVPAALVVSNPSNQTVYPLGPIPNLVSVGPPVTLAAGQSVTENQAVNTDTTNGLTIAGGYSAPGSYTASAYFGFSSGSASSGSTTVGPLPVTVQ